MTDSSDQGEAVRELSLEECWTRLNAGGLARLAIAVADVPDIFPINFLSSSGQLLFRTAPGSKLLGLSANPRVALEVDGHDDASAFSVVVKGHAERVESQQEVDRLDTLGLVPWIPTLKYRWVRVVPDEVTGRSFLRGPEPERY